MATDLTTMIRVNDLFKREQHMRDALEKVRSLLFACMSDLQASERIKYTGWTILLKRKEVGWECVGIVNPDVTPEDQIPEEFDASLPIPEPATLPEFQG